MACISKIGERVCYHENKDHRLEEISSNSHNAMCVHVKSTASILISSLVLITLAYLFGNFLQFFKYTTHIFFINLRNIYLLHIFSSTVLYCIIWFKRCFELSN